MQSSLGSSKCFCPGTSHQMQLPLLQKGGRVHRHPGPTWNWGCWGRTWARGGELWNHAKSQIKLVLLDCASANSICFVAQFAGILASSLTLSLSPSIALPEVFAAKELPQNPMRTRYQWVASSTVSFTSHRPRHLIVHVQQCQMSAMREKCYDTPQL